MSASRTASPTGDAMDVISTASDQEKINSELQRCINQCIELADATRDLLGLRDMRKSVIATLQTNLGCTAITSQSIIDKFDHRKQCQDIDPLGPCQIADCSTHYHKQANGEITND